MIPADFNPPWKMKPLDEWNVITMTHLNVAGEKHLYVAMTKDGVLIEEGGPDDVYLWNRLWHKAVGTSEKKEAGEKC